jgi:hypothetical protein
MDSVQQPSPSSPVTSERYADRELSAASAELRRSAAALMAIVSLKERSPAINKFLEMARDVLAQINEQQPNWVGLCAGLAWSHYLLLRNETVYGNWLELATAVNGGTTISVPERFWAKAKAGPGPDLDVAVSGIVADILGD